MPKVMPEDLLNKGLGLLVKKGQDYTKDRESNTFENFDRSAEIASWFKNDRDKTFAVLIGTKLARLASLLNSDKPPNNESIEDTFIDGSNYFALWGGRVLSESGVAKPRLSSCRACGLTFEHPPTVLNTVLQGSASLVFFCSALHRESYANEYCKSNKNATYYPNQNSLIKN